MAAQRDCAFRTINQLTLVAMPGAVAPTPGPSLAFAAPTAAAGIRLRPF